MTSSIKNKSLHIVSLLFISIMALPNIVSAMTVSVGIPDAFSQVQAGNKIYFETEIKWPENTGRKDLRIDYSILDKNKTEIAQLKVLRAIETQVSFMDGIAVPADALCPVLEIFAVSAHRTALWHSHSGFVIWRICCFTHELSPACSV